MYTVPYDVIQRGGVNSELLRCHPWGGEEPEGHLYVYLRRLAQTVLHQVF